MALRDNGDDIVLEKNGWVEVVGYMVEAPSTHLSIENAPPALTFFLRMQAAVETPISMADGAAL